MPGVIAFFVREPNRGSIRGLFKRIFTRNMILVGGCHDFRTIQEKAERLSIITRNPTGRGEPKHSKFCGGFLYACALLHCMTLAGVFTKRSLPFV
jgi:hypothetical protein